MNVHFVYITAASRDEALTIARTVVEERLAACANILAPITSVFWWDGGAQEEEEVGVILKTRGALIDRLTERIKALHSYECPCVVAWPITAGNPAFLDWILSETGVVRSN